MSGGGKRNKHGQQLAAMRAQGAFRVSDDGEGYEIDTLDLVPPNKTFAAQFSLFQSSGDTNFLYFAQGTPDGRLSSVVAIQIYDDFLKALRESFNDEFRRALSQHARPASDLRIAPDLFKALPLERLVRYFANLASISTAGKAGQIDFYEAGPVLIRKLRSNRPVHDPMGVLTVYLSTAAINDLVLQIDERVKTLEDSKVDRP